ncbi:TerB family tellurite resistance protein [Chthonobacter rhizosphaerae]|uniref:tellurite resistance TerB family protein n=1 Tax=Chthonobacter rhizosphaerae TaxID=2735553 RepID=UPI0015EF2176|nr:TerB family tellurite resistance protein [Chthonobacter rhizosphaerae]
MFDSLKSLLADLSGPRREENAMDERLATAALLIHTIAVDGEISPKERAQLRAALTGAFGLSRTETDALIEEARERDREAVDLYGFTSVLKRSLDAPGRERVIEMMWEIVFADGGVHEFEDNIVWRVAELLGVSARDRIRLRKRIEGRLAQS